MSSTIFHLGRSYFPIPSEICGRLFLYPSLGSCNLICGWVRCIFIYKICSKLGKLGLNNKLNHYTRKTQVTQQVKRCLKFAKLRLNNLLLCSSFAFSRIGINKNCTNLFLRTWNVHFFYWENNESNISKISCKQFNILIS